ncbi:Prolyl 4-hydroxylase alpha subunit [Penicillium taxi]|uniref:Prolyl 4-hydroxylase alpha subunit n=1 Tax=Penicillium taxi TaxID=168475 RepID=UPI002544E247|nr:Prolyl 4-hydroxylase alpha subunit [Penicillium taxi]KAJ5895394.1 Prolyl 4-hydroxylase alpha subunit [Penicillium taxi]
MSNIPEDFLRGPPQNAKVHKIDFTQTTPPIPAFKGQFAVVIDNFMTEAESASLLKLAQTTTSQNETQWERAMVNAGSGKEVMSVDTRKSGRMIFDSPDIAQRLLDRLMPFLQDFHIDRVHAMPQVTGLGPTRRGETFRVSRLNERLRFLRYEGGDYFRPHWDGCYVTPDGKEKSLFTVHLYLNGDGEQDMEELLPEIQRVEKEAWPWEDGGDEDQVLTDAEAVAHPLTADPEAKLLGGATSFIDGFRGDCVRVFPKAGTVLIFQQRNLMHCGDDVFRGVKYTVRTDVMYTQE